MCFHRVLKNLAKWNSLSFPGFPDPLNSLFQIIIKWKPDVTNHRSSQTAFLQNYRIFYWRSMVTGSIHASRCVTQPIYATVTDNYAHNSMPKRYHHIANDKFPEFSRINKFPEISMISRFSTVVSTLFHVCVEMCVWVNKTVTRQLNCSMWMVQQHKTLDRPI